MADTDVEGELRQLEADLRRLEAEYNMFFAGALPRPPWETRRRVEASIKRFDRSYIQSYKDRFRFSTLQSRYTTFTDLWDRGLRAREEGRAGPFATRKPQEVRADEKTGDRVVHVTTFADPGQETDKLRELYERLSEARRQTGEPAVPFSRFADLITHQVVQQRQSGSPEVAFRVTVKEGKVNLTVRALKGMRKNEE